MVNGGTQLAIQLYGVVLTIVWSTICTFVILLLLDYTIGVRVSEEAEEIGLDNSLHRNSLSLNNSFSASRNQHNRQLIFLPRISPNDIIGNLETGKTELEELE